MCVIFLNAYEKSTEKYVGPYVPIENKQKTKYNTWRKQIIFVLDIHESIDIHLCVTDMSNAPLSISFFVICDPQLLGLMENNDKILI